MGAFLPLLLMMGMGAAMAAKKPPQPELPPPEPPVAMPEKGSVEASQRHKMIKAGRGGTILTGQLAPQNIGKKRVLG